MEAYSLHGAVDRVTQLGRDEEAVALYPTLQFRLDVSAISFGRLFPAYRFHVCSVKIVRGNSRICRQLSLWQIAAEVGEGKTYLVTT